MSKIHLASIGSVYLETNYLATETAGKNTLQVGQEYRSSSYTVGLGGSAVNFAVQASKLGISVSLIGKVGDDEQGKKVLALFTEQNIQTDFIRVARDVQTGVDTGIVLAHSGQNIQLVSGNANQTFSYLDIPLDHPLFVGVSAVYLGGYFKQESLYSDYPKLLKQLKETNKQIFLDHGRVPVDVHTSKIAILKEALPYVDGYFLNDTELYAITEETVFASAINKIVSWGPKCIVVKQGDQGCTVVVGKNIKSIPTEAAHAQNTVGAGDAFNAGFLSKYLCGSDAYDAAAYANRIATYKVAHNVVVLPDMIDN